MIFGEAEFNTDTEQPLHVAVWIQTTGISRVAAIVSPSLEAVSPRESRVERATNHYRETRWGSEIRSIGAPLAR